MKNEAEPENHASRAGALGAITLGSVLAYFASPPFVFKAADALGLGKNAALCIDIFYFPAEFLYNKVPAYHWYVESIFALLDGA